MPKVELQIDKNNLNQKRTLKKLRFSNIIFCSRFIFPLEIRNHLHEKDILPDINFIKLP